MTKITEELEKIYNKKIEQISSKKETIKKIKNVNLLNINKNYDLLLKDIQEIRERIAHKENISISKYGDKFDQNNHDNKINFFYNKTKKIIRISFYFKKMKFRFYYSDFSFEEVFPTILISLDRQGNIKIEEPGTKGSMALTKINNNKNYKDSISYIIKFVAENWAIKNKRYE